MKITIKQFVILLLMSPVISPAVSPLFAQNTRDAIWNYHTGRDLESRNRLNEAGYYYNEAIRIATNEISRNAAGRDSYTALTWALQRQQRYQDVITWGERGLRLYADEFRIIETMGEAYFYLNDLDESLRFMQRYTNSVPNGERTSVAYFFIGEIYRYKRLFRHADIAYTTAVRLEPGVALWWYRLGTVREVLRDYAQASSAYERALGLNPGYLEAENALARTNTIQGSQTNP